MTDKKHYYCTRCDEALKENREIWLELDTRTGTYSKLQVPSEYSQGSFPFGLDCAKIAVKDHEKAMMLLNTEIPENEGIH